MSEPCLIALTLGDQDFRSTVDSVLRNYTDVKIHYHDDCSFSLNGSEAESADILLINADRFQLTEKCRKNFRKLAQSAREKDKTLSIFMLTRNLTVADFIRNQSFMVKDTIDINNDLGVLEMALDNALLSLHSHA